MTFHVNRPLVFLISLHGNGITHLTQPPEVATVFRFTLKGAKCIVQAVQTAFVWLTHCLEEVVPIYVSDRVDDREHRTFEAMFFFEVLQDFFPKRRR